jgi:hypothetical protein
VLSIECTSTIVFYEARHQPTDLRNIEETREGLSSAV